MIAFIQTDTPPQLTIEQVEANRLLRVRDTALAERRKRDDTDGARRRDRQTVSDSELI